GPNKLLTKLQAQAKSRFLVGAPRRTIFIAGAEEARRSLGSHSHSRVANIDPPIVGILLRKNNYRPTIPRKFYPVGQKVPKNALQLMFIATHPCFRRNPVRDTDLLPIR